MLTNSRREIYPSSSLSSSSTSNFKNNNNNNNIQFSSFFLNWKKNSWGTKNIDIFEKLEQIGEGTYGKVYKARNRETGEIVALKKIRMDKEKEGFPITAIREIKILKELHHTNIVQLKDIVTGTKKKQIPSIYMVFEYMDHDLTGLMMMPEGLFNPNPSEIKCYMKQLLEGLVYCHLNHILHRDIKGSNLLISNNGILKLADFGLARPFSEQKSRYTNTVITLWYRPPELLLGCDQYGPEVDVWSAGCIFAELLLKKALFPGKNEIEQLELIWNICGTPTKENWPGIENLPHWEINKPKKFIPRNIRKYFAEFPEEVVELLDLMLTLNPAKRITAHDALDKKYFWKEPKACEPSKLTKFPRSSHEFQEKKRRQQRQPPLTDPKRQKGDYGFISQKNTQITTNNFPKYYPSIPSQYNGKTSIPTNHSGNKFSRTYYKSNEYKLYDYKSNEYKPSSEYKSYEYKPLSSNEYKYQSSQSSNFSKNLQSNNTIHKSSPKK